jgi:transposase
MKGRQRRSITHDYKAASGRSGGFERSFDRVGGQGTWPARFRVAALGGIAWGWADPAAEIARLQRENERLRMERDILKKSIAIFLGDRNESQLHRRLPRRLSCATCSPSRRPAVMPGAPARRAGDRPPIVSWSTTSSRSRHPRTLWQPAHPCRADGSGPRGEPRSDRAVDAHHES